MDRRDKHRGLRPQGLERWVVNLTDHSLSKPQEDVLKLGLGSPGKGMWDPQACQASEGQPDQGAEEGPEGAKKPGG